MTDYFKNTGSTGQMLIRDNGAGVEFWLRAGSQTFNYQLPWAYTINGVWSGWRQFRFEQGGNWQLLGSWGISTSQTVRFEIGASGTVGLGGPTIFDQYISRSSAPGPPSAVTLTNKTSTSMHATFSDGANNGQPITIREIGYGTNEVTPQFIVSSDLSTDITGLTPGTLYYFWARTANLHGYGPWGGRSQGTTLRVPFTPDPPAVSNLTQLTATVTWTPPASGGTGILEYELGYGTSSAGPSTTISGNPPRNLTGLLPGRTYYFWVRARNAVGWGAWSNPTVAKTIAGARVKASGVWKDAVPYVKVAGVWRVARPWVRYVGVWKESS